MKKLLILTYICGGMMALTSCHDLDLNPLSSGSTENWYSTETEVQMAVDELYQIDFWPEDGQQQNDWSDDYTSRNNLTDFDNGTLNGQNIWVTNLWNYQYKAISRANAVIEKSHRAIENGASAEKVNRLIAEAKFHRAAAYAKLVVKFGDVPLILTDVTTEEGLTMGRTDKSTVLSQIYKDFDEAIEVLPVSYADQQRATKGAALALKARVALIMEDWKTAATAAKSVMDLGVYELHPDFRSLFLSGTKTSKEFIFVIPRDAAYGSYLSCSYGIGGVNMIYNDLSRNPGGWLQTCPSWELLAAFTCTDGKLIDESTLFDPHDPFKNRDPRLAETIVPFGTNHLGYEYDPHPEKLTCMNYNTGQEVKNNDTRANAQYASFDGLVWRKGIDETWLQNGKKVSQNLIYCRYAEVLLTYAEAKIELNQIDQSVLDALNSVRARAYGVAPSVTDQYPAFTSTDQNTLRHQLRVERRMEMAKEHMRYTDIIRWKLAPKVMSRKTYGIVYPASLCIEQVTSQGDWFWAFTPDVDEDGCADFSALEAAGKCQSLAVRSWNDRQYLWPIPTTELQINPNLKPNPGY